jgi:Gpi18-like mannosyltransferase
MSMHQSISADCTANSADRPLPWWLQLSAVAMVSLCLHSLCGGVVPPDMNRFLYPWYDHIVAKGPIAAFSEPFSNYTPTYLYLLATASLAHDLAEPLTIIKFLSVLGTGFLAISVADLLNAMGAKARGAALVFVLPTAVLNAAMLGQCDALWAGCCIFCIAGMIRGRTLSAVIWAGAAIVQGAGRVHRAVRHRRADRPQGAAVAMGRSSMLR